MGSNLLHSIITEGKKEFLRKLCLVLKEGILSKKKTDFCRSYKRDKAFCTIGGFEVTLNLIPDKFSL